MDKICPEGKEINPKTGRCVAECKNTEERNIETGKCVKKIVKIEDKICPEGKEINPKTGRCVAICKDTEKRNIETGKCVKKFVKIEDKIKSKICPEGKEINPKTGRCVAECKDGKFRDILTGKCVKKPKQVPTSHPKTDPKSVSPPHPKTDPKTVSPPHPKTDPKSVSPPHHKTDPKSLSPAHPKSDSKSDPKSDKSFKLYYPDLEDPEFTSKIANNMEFAIHKIPDFPIIRSIEDFNKVSNRLCGTFETALYQHFVSQYISYRTPYKSILLYHGVGVGKTCSAITLSESLLTPHTTLNEPMIWVIMPHSLKQSFKSQIFDIDNHTFKNITNQCTGDNYVKLINIYESSFNNKNKINTDLKKILKSRYRVFTYDGFSKYIKDNYSDKIVENKVIIIDEAHNVRSTNKKDKDSFIALTKSLIDGVNNRLILLSATPMYNEPRDILDLFKLMLINDKRTDILKDNSKIFNNIKLKIDENVMNLIKKLTSTYISYLRGKNPFTFALKLNPSNSNIKILKKSPINDPSNKPINTKELNWLKHIRDGIITSKLGISQKNIIDKLGYNKLIKDEDISDDIDEESVGNKQNQNMKLLQPMNIVYDTDIGSDGFYTFFTKTKAADPISVRYNKKYKNALYPDEEHLGKHSGKFLNMCNFIRKSKGIVVIYSRFLLSGILPFAICLEHLGYSREGTNNILANADIVHDKPIYDNVKTPKYCILTSDKKEIMGSTNIDNLIKKINKPENSNGELIKVILITPVASEGLSFYNAREIHLIEPWYHFNRPDQIIGRGIRNCRHQSLPLEERNVTVFMHASIDDDENKETIDIHALRISTRKYRDSIKVDRIITDNALDCGIMKNINYFPKSLFKMGKVKINTSQGNVYEYEFGDNVKDEPQCYSKNKHIDKSGYRSEVYKHLLKRTQNSLINLVDIYIKLNIYFINFETLYEKMAIDKDLLMYTVNKSIYPYILLNGYYIIIHKNGIRVIINDLKYSNKLSIVIEDKKYNEEKITDNVVIDYDNIEDVLNMIEIDYIDKHNTTLSIYLNLDSESFEKLMKKILSIYDKKFDKKIEYIIECLYEQGVLIKNREIKSFNKNDNIYIGYVNIYDINNKDNNNDNLDINLHIKGTDIYNSGVSKRERDEFFKSRSIRNTIPVDMTVEKTPWGIIEPFKGKTGIVNKFKIFSIDPVIGKGKKTGRVCETYYDIDHNNFVKQINNDDINHKMKNKKIYCKYIANKLFGLNKLILYPLYKPIVK